MRVRTLLCLPLVVWLCSAARAQIAIPSEKPVSPGLLSGRELRIEDSNFRIEAPGKGWTWSLLEHDALQGVPCYACKKGMFVAFLVTVQKGKTWDTGEGFRRGLREGMERTAQKSSAKVLSCEISPCDVPLPGSLRIDAVMKHAIGLEMQTQTYVCAAGNIYTIEVAWIRGGPRPAEFDAFVKSFALLRPAPRPSLLPDLPWGSIAGVVVLCMALGGGRSRGVLKAALVLAALLSIALLVVLGLAVVSMESGRFSMEEVAERCGHALIPLLLGMCGALIAARRLRKLRTDVAAQPFPPLDGPLPLPPPQP